VITSVAQQVAASREILLGKEEQPKSATARYDTGHRAMSGKMISQRANMHTLFPARFLFLHSLEIQRWPAVRRHVVRLLLSLQHSPPRPLRRRQF
jgi:hypothetical protein